MKLVLKKQPLPFTPTPAAELLSEFAETIDLVGDLTLQAAPLMRQAITIAEKLKPLNEAKAKLQALMNSIGADDEDVVQLGVTFKAEAGKRGTKRSIKDMAAVKKTMGNELFLQLATVTLSNMDKYCTPPQLAELLDTERTGRTLKVLRRV